MRKIASYFLLVALVVSCTTSDKGQLVGVRGKKKYVPEKPYGMVLIEGSAFTMGKQDEDVAGAINAPARTVTVRSYYMDETEITNSEYKEFVHWVRDSTVRSKLAILSDEMSGGSVEEGGILAEFAFKAADTANASEYEKYMMANYGGTGDVNSPTQGRMLDWEEELVWDLAEFPDEYYTEVMDSMFVPLEDSFDGRRMIDYTKLKFTYKWLDQEGAARAGERRKDHIISETVPVYPDTTVWIKDFKYSYNDPMHQDYFSHDAYGDYPVVGVKFKQAQAFCAWRSKKHNDYLLNRKTPSRVSNYRLPTEAEWEFAARGGLQFASYPWGNNYTTSDRGCFLANFKPSRGDYAVDNALYTIEVKSYNPNDYGLYDMAGNVSEWTNSAYNESSYYLGSTLSPNVEDRENKRKVIRGGSWKDVAYFLEVSTRDYEYADSARSYIGFRTVQDYLGD